MPDKQTFNLLPEEQKKVASEELKKVPAASKKEVKLVIPKQEAKELAKHEKKQSMMQRFSNWRKKKKEEKQRKRGEVGHAQKHATKEIKPASTSSEHAELFSHVMNEEPKEHWWEKKSAPMAKAAPAPAMPAKPTTVPKPQPVPEKKPEKPKMPAPAPQQPKKEEPKYSAVVPAGEMHHPSAGESFEGPSVNLVPAMVRQQEQGSPWVLSGAILAFALALCVITGGLLYARVRSAQAKADQLSQQISQVDVLLKDLNASKVAAQHLQQQYEAVSRLLDKHLYWTVFLQKLQELTIPDIYYSSIDANIETSVINLHAVAKDYAAAARQLRSFEKAPDLISSVTIGQAKVENQPNVKIPVPIVTIDYSLHLKNGVLNVQPSQ